MLTRCGLTLALYDAHDGLTLWRWLTPDGRCVALVVGCRVASHRSGRSEIDSALTNDSCACVTSDA